MMIKQYYVRWYKRILFLLLPGLVLMSAQSAIAEIDPDCVAKLLAGDGASSDSFGISVSVSGDTAVIGAIYEDQNGYHSGSAYVFIHSSGSWSQQAKLTATDGASDDLFGYSVSVSGDTAVIGTRYGDGYVSDSGSAYVFIRTGVTWSQQAKLIASDGVADDYFGYSVSVSGDTAVIGAYEDYDNGINSGSAYVFIRSGVTWSYQDKLIADDAADDDYFGRSVSVSGETAVIGAYQDDDNGIDSGSAYVFTRNSGSWSQQDKLKASDGVQGDRFGKAVSVFGDTAVIGAPTDDDNGGSGTAFVFTRSGENWSELTKLTPSSAGTGYFGGSVSVSGDTAVIGAEKDDDNGSLSGAAYVFICSSGIWSEQTKLTAFDAAGIDLFGRSVSVSGDTAVIGTFMDDDNGPDSGSAYTFGSVCGDPSESRCMPPIIWLLTTSSN